MTERSMKRNPDGSISLNLEAMQMAADKSKAERTEQAKQRLAHINDKNLAEQKQVSDLFAKAIRADRQDRERTEAKRIDADNKRLLKQHEAELEAKGLATERSKKLEAGYRSMLTGLATTRGMTDKQAKYY